MAIFKRKKEDVKRESERLKILEMTKTEGWQISYGYLLDALKEMNTADNIENELELKSVQRTNKIMSYLLQTIYGIIIEPEDLRPEIQEDELYKLLAGDESQSGIE